MCRTTRAAIRRGAGEPWEITNVDLIERFRVLAPPLPRKDTT